MRHRKDNQRHSPRKQSSRKKSSGSRPRGHADLPVNGRHAPPNIDITQSDTGAPPKRPGSPDEHRVHHRHEVVKDFLIGAFCAILLGLSQFAVQRTDFGAQMELAAYNLIQHHLQSQVSDADLPVAVVDISDIPTVPVQIGGVAYSVTPRDKLTTLITALLRRHVKAIGIDVDFSPDSSLPAYYQTTQDPNFFRNCLDQRRATGIPIYLGINRTVPLPPEQWLAPGFSSLAASMVVPANDTELLIAWTQVKGGQTCPTLADRLSSAVVGNRTVPWRPVRPFISATAVTSPKPGLSISSFAVDYSPLAGLIAAGAQTPSHMIVEGRGPDLHGKVVLLGDAVPGATSDEQILLGRQVPRVYMHACAAATLISLPLVKPTRLGQIALDILVAFFLLGGIVWVRLYFHERKGIRLDADRVQGLLIGVQVAIVIALGIWLVRWTRLLWNDFLLAVFMLLLHPGVHKHVHTAHHHVRRHGWRGLSPATWRREPDQGGGGNENHLA